MGGKRLVPPWLQSVGVAKGHKLQNQNTRLSFSGCSSHTHTHTHTLIGKHSSHSDSRAIPLLHPSAPPPLLSDDNACQSQKRDYPPLVPPGSEWFSQPVLFPKAAALIGEDEVWEGLCSCGGIAVSFGLQGTGKESELPLLQGGGGQ